MKFITIIFLIIASNLYAQDSDGDGILDVEELKYYNAEESPIAFNPFISELPFININFSGEVRIGVQTKISEEEKYSTELKSSFSTEEGESARNKHYTSKTFRNKTEAKVTLGFKNIINSLTPTLGLDISNTTSYEYSQELNYTNESWESWKSIFEETQKKMKSRTRSFGSDDGYISTSITLFNPTNANITIDKLYFTFFEYDLFTGAVDFNSPFANIKQVIFLDESSGQRKYVLTPGVNGPYKIHIPQINTASILDILENHRSFVFKLEKNFELEYSFTKDDGTTNTYNWSTRKMPIARNTFKLRIIDEESDRTFYVAKKDKDGHYRNLKSALNLIYPSGIDYEKTENSEGKEVEYIYSMDSKFSELNISKSFADFDSDDLKKGYWFKIFNDNGGRYKGDLNEPIKPIDVEITLIYVRGKDLVPIKKPKDNLAYSKEFELLKTETIVTDFAPLEGDSIVLEISAFEEKYFSEQVPTSLLNIQCQGVVRSIKVMETYQNAIPKFTGQYLIQDDFGIALKLENITFSLMDLILKEKRLHENKYVYSKLIEKRHLVYNDKLSIFYSQNEFSTTPITVYEGFISFPKTMAQYRGLFRGTSCLPTYDEYIKLLTASGLKPKTVYPKIKAKILLKVFR